jgi:hypothetical protein
MVTDSRSWFVTWRLFKGSKAVSDKSCRKVVNIKVEETVRDGKQA